MELSALLTVFMLRFALCADESAAGIIESGNAVERPLVGAIRWDAWHGEQGVPGRAVQHALSPKKWHYRLPFFAKILGADKVLIDGSSQDIMDREIEYAHQAGLDYWAFVTYQPDDPMSLGLKRYLNSSKRGDVNFCLLTECGRWSDPEYVDRLVRLMREECYQKVLDDRPLLFLGFIKEGKLRHWGGVQGFSKVLGAFREAVRDSGLAEPYVVIMDRNSAQGKRWVDELGCDAVSSYAIGGFGKNLPYLKLTENTENFWDQCKVTGSQVVPVIMAGWDRRPRVARPVPWEQWQKPGVGIESFYQQAKPDEIAAHLQNALTWMKANRSSARSQVAIIYAWNENDEGGWLVPTLSEGIARVDAIRKVLEPR